METDNTPCLSCGACCATYRASFYWAESDLVTPNGVPHELAEHFPPHFLVMRGTGSPNPRCVALRGEIGVSVYCEIYERRSSVCRDFPPSFENGVRNEWCDKARLKWGLSPLDGDSWTSGSENGRFPRAA
ncbi:MAG: YkgJ family cysteine cluster protein [Desulfobulbaceae bacterium]